MTEQSKLAKILLNYKFIYITGFIIAIISLLNSIIAIDWEAFIYHGSRELHIPQSGLMHFIFSNLDKIFYLFFVIFTLTPIIGLIFKIDKTYYKIIVAVTLALSLLLTFLEYFVAFGVSNVLINTIGTLLPYILIILLFIFLLAYFFFKCEFKNKITASITAVIIAGILLLPFMKIGAFKFRADPVVFDGGDNYVVAWSTNYKSIAYLEVDVNGQKKEFYDIENSVLRYNDVYHKVEVPKILDGQPVKEFSYKLINKKVLWRSAAFYKYGKTITSNDYKFSTIPLNKDKVSVVAISDIHQMYQQAVDVSNNLGDADFYLVMGDNQTATFTQDMALKNLDVLGNISKGRKLVYPVRGNHETRGSHAYLFNKYMTTPTNNFCYDINFNNLQMAVIDTGDDWEDDKPINGGISHYTENTQNQKEFVDNLDFTQSKWKVAVGHMNIIKKTGNVHNFDILRKSIDDAGVNLFLHGHDHISGKDSILKIDNLTNIDMTFSCGGKYVDKKYLVGTKIVFEENNINFLQMDKTKKVFLNYNHKINN